MNDIADTPHEKVREELAEKGLTTKAALVENHEGRRKTLPASKPIGTIYNSRCKACNHIARTTIDKLCVTPNVSYREIGRMFDLNFSGVANHAKHHITYENAAIREIIADEARQRGEVISNGVQGEMARNVFLRSYVQKTTEALLEGELPLSGKEAMTAIEMLRNAEEEQYAYQLEKLTTQLDAYQQAMKEIVPNEMWYLIVDRMEQLLNGDVDPIVEAEVVEDNELSNLNPRAIGQNS